MKKRTCFITLCFILESLFYAGFSFSSKAYAALPGSCDGTTTPTLGICVPPLGQDPWFEEWLDFATKVDTHAAGTTVHGATALNTANRIILRDPSGNFAAGTMTGNITGNAGTASVLLANPVDCGANTFATAIAANGNLTCSAVSIAGSIYLPLAAGSGSPLTGQLYLDNLGAEFEESDTNPTCASGRYSLYADLSEAKFKKCTNGVVTDLDAGSGSGTSAFADLTSGTNTTAAMVVGTGGSLAVSGSGTIAATTAAALAANPTDCTTNQFANTIAANGNLTCAAITDADVPDTVTVSNYLLLAGGTMTGQLITDNLGIEFAESDTNPTCAAGNFNVFADLSENKLKKCTNGTVTDLDTGGAGSGDVVGPGSATDNALVRFDTTTGKLVQNSAVIVDDSNNLTGAATITLPNTGLHILDTNASHDLIIVPGSDVSADRTLTITTGDADRTLTMNASTVLGGGAHSGTNTGDQTITLTGEVTGSGSGSFATTIANNTISNAKAVDMANATIKCRVTAGTGDPEDCTGTQTTTLLDAFTSGAKGLAPASGGGTSNFLRADGTWTTPPGGGDITDVFTCATGDCSTISAGAGDVFSMASGLTSVPQPQSTTLPATCGEGEQYQDTDSGGTETYKCTATNTWTKLVAPTDNVATATALAANPTDCSANEFANTIAASGNLTCAALVDADIPDTVTINLAATASALAANGANCSSGNSPLGVDASGVTEGCFDVMTQVEGDLKVTGPASATDNVIARYDATTGKLIQNSGVTIDDSNNVNTPGTVTSLSMTTSGTSEGEVTFNEASANGSNFVRIRGNVSRAGDLTYVIPSTDPTAGQVLSAGAPSGGISTLSWSSAGAGDVTDVWACTTGNCNALTGAAGDSLNAASADSIIPLTQSTSLPGTCSEGQFHQDTDSGGVEAYLCTATDTWVKFIAGTDNVATATALAANPTDCSANQFANTIAASGNLTCAALVDADVPDTITASNYLLLSGGTLTGQLVTDNLGIEFDESETNPTCAAGNYAIYADLSETKLKKCENGVVGDIGAGGGGSGDITDVWGCTTGDCSTLTAASGDSLNAASATSIIPLTQSASLPGTCTEGQLHQDTDSGGTETYLCTAANTWTKIIAETDNVATATALAANPSDCAANQFANTIAASGNLTCAALADADVPNTITVDLAATATAFAANPADCSANQFANAIAASGALTCSALADADVPDTITASNYLLLTGGTLTGQLITDNLGVEFDESDTNPTCAAGNYNIYADTSEAKLKKCTNGTVTDLDVGGGGSGDVVGPGSATDNALARFDTTTGKLIQNSTVALGDAGEMQWTDTTLVRDFANTLSIRNGTTAQEFSVVNTWTSSSVYEWVSISWLSNVATLRTETTGGTARNLSLNYGNSANTAITVPTGTSSPLDLVNSSPSTSAATNGLVRISNTSHTATSGTTVAANVVPTFSSSSTATTVGVGLRIGPTVNYSNGTPGSGGYEALKVAVTETALQTGTNYLARFSAGAAGTTDRFFVENSGRVTQAGHHIFTGTAPTPSACGTSPSVVGTDSVGRVTIGTGTVTSCTLTFATAFANAPVCVVTNETTIQAHKATPTTTTLVLGATTDMASDVIAYHCFGRN